MEPPIGVAEPSNLYRPMKSISKVLALVSLLWFTGCASTDEVITDSTKRQSTASIDVFKDGQTPNRQFKPIAELSFLGPREEELRAQKFFTGRAEKLGGNAIVFTVAPAGQKGGGIAFSTAFLFKGLVVVYE